MKTIDAEIERLQELRHAYGGGADLGACSLYTFTFDAKLIGYCQVKVQASSLQAAEDSARLEVERFCKEVPAWDLRNKSLELTLLGH